MRLKPSASMQLSTAANHGFPMTLTSQFSVSTLETARSARRRTQEGALGVAADRQAQPAYDASTPVLVLKTQPRLLHHGAIGAIRTLGRVGVTVHGCEPAGAPAERSRYLAQPSLGPLAGDASHDVAALADFQRRLGRPLAVVAVDDEGARLLAENADALAPGILLPAQSPDLPREVASKAKLPQLRRIPGVTIPRTVVVNASRPATPVEMSYPLMVKAAEPRLLPPSSRPVFLARGEEELARYAERLDTRSGGAADLVLQEYIPDAEAEDWFYHGYHAAGGDPVVGFTGIKLRSWPPFGATSYAVSVYNAAVAALARRILRNLEYAGVVELEFRLDKRDGVYKLIDFNPRLGAQFKLLRNENGVDVVRAMHLDLTGREVPRGRQVEWTAFVSDFADPLAFAAHRGRAHHAGHAWVRQFLSAEARSWFARDDMGPFWAAGLQSTRSSVRFSATAVRRAVANWRPGKAPAHVKPFPKASPLS